MITDYTELGIWKRAEKYTLKVYGATTVLPKEEKYGITSQFRRAAMSIQLNIAEGFERGFSKDYVRFLNMAKGSAGECRALAILVRKLDLMNSEECNALEAEAVELGKMLGGTMKTIRQKLK